MWRHTSESASPRSRPSMVSRQHRHTSPRSNAALQSRVRIIGGRWRGVPLAFPALPQLRPTPDRVRETLFNWLQPMIVGARCLDLFAGSGALGIEALSRGAGSVTFVDRDPQIGKHLAGVLARLGVPSGEGAAAVAVADALAFLAGPAPAPAFDIVFLDPPYAADCLAPVCQ